MIAFLSGEVAAVLPPKVSQSVSSSRVSSNQTAPAVMSGMPSRKMPFSATR